MANPGTAPAQELEARLRELRLDQRNVALPGLFATIIGILILLLLPAVLGGWHWLWMFPLMGILQYRLVISGHEAVHSTLCQPKPLNEWLGVLGQAAVGVNFTAYRLQHMDHHKVRTRAEDPDGHIYGTVIDTPAGWRRFLVLTLGTFVELIIKIRQKGTGGFGNRENHPPDIVARKRRDSILVILAQFSLIGITWASTGLFWGYALLWIGPLFTVAVFLNRCRIVIEHGLAHQIAASLPGGMSEFGGPRIPTVDIVPHPIEAWIFAPFKFHYHCCHHLFMAVPHYNLPKVRALLREAQHPGYHEVHGSYLSALLRCIRTGSSPT